MPLTTTEYIKEKDVVYEVVKTEVKTDPIIAEISRLEAEKAKMIVYFDEEIARLTKMKDDIEKAPIATAVVVEEPIR